MKYNNKLVAIDLGSSTIRLAVAEITDDGSLEVRFITEHPMQGMKNGLIVNYDEALHSLKAIVSEMNANVEGLPRSVSIGIGGAYISTEESIGTLKHPKGGASITADDIKAVLENARANLSVKSGWRVIHSVPIEYKVGDTEKVLNPINMPSRPLEARVLFLLQSEDQYSSLSHLFNEAGLKIENVYATPLSSSTVLIDKDEKESGVIIVDIGEDSSSIISYLAGHLTFIGGIEIGSGHITSDLAYIFQRNKGTCKMLKEEYGNAYLPLVSKDAMITLADRDEKVKVPETEFTAIIQPRMTEIFTLLKKELDKNPRYGSYSSGLILTGGGSLIGGATELAKSVFYLSTRLGFPEALSSLSREYINPKYVTLLGLLKQAALASPLYRVREAYESYDSGKKESKGLKSLWKKLF